MRRFYKPHKDQEWSNRYSENINWSIPAVTISDFHDTIIMSKRVYWWCWHKNIDLLFSLFWTIIQYWCLVTEPQCNSSKLHNVCMQRWNLLTARYQGVWGHISVAVLTVSQGKSVFHTKVGDAAAKHLRHESFGFSCSFTSKWGTN